MKIDLHFTENSDGTIEFTPIDVDRARLIYRQLIERLSYLRKKIDAKQNLLDITPKENDVLKKDCLIKIIMYKADLEVTQNQFKSVKKWYDNHKLPYPGSHKDRLKKDLLEDYKSRKKKKKLNTNEDIFRFNGDFWTVRYKGKEKFIKHTKGMDYIAYLFRHQAQDIHSMELYQAITEGIPDTDTRMSKMSSKKIESDEGLSKEDKEKYKMLTPEVLKTLENHRKQLETSRDKAMMENDSAKEAEISSELEKIENYIKKNTNKWGKPRDFPDRTEKMRISINKAIKTAKNNIDKVHKELFSHIDKYLETGTYNIYRPEIPIIWVQDN